MAVVVGIGNGGPAVMGVTGAGVAAGGCRKDGRPASCGVDSDKRARHDMFGRREEKQNEPTDNSLPLIYDLV